MAENESTIYNVTYWDPETNTFKTYTEAELNALRSDNLKLSKINRNGTISEMMDTIDQNFQNIAAHGGGPAGFDGRDGINGADGTSAEYIFALCDEELEAGTHYPTTDLAKNNLFDSVEMNGSQWFPSKNSNIKIQWFDHPQGVSKEHKNEYVFSRVVRVQGETRKWEPAEKPELWAHWGETGRDGDGVEYIFMRSDKKLDDSTLKSIIKSKKSMSGDKYQSVIYQMDGFFPGEDWFKDDKNKTNVWKAINAKYGEVPSDFETLWSNRFNMIVPGYDWTDEPKGTDPINVYEYVAIRRCNVDDEDRKEWGDFSTPAIWSHYGLSTRTIIIYCNTEDTTSPVSPQSGQGSWNESEGKLTLPNPLVEAGWKDTNETPSENQITWMCSGIFDNSGKNVSWSKPMRITGKDGKQGEDGTTVEFIYALSKDMPAHPTIEKETTDSKPGVINTKEELFDAAKNANTEYNGQVWYDRAQPISPDKPTEYVWSRRRDKESEPWEYEDEPIIWAHWGEDGTDGDGVEYIFAVTLNNPPTTSLALPVYENLNDDQKAIFQIDDFYPDESWFTKTQVKNGITTYPNKEKVQKVLGDRFDETKWSSYYGFNISSGWSDNPVEVGPSTPYQWVSIRRSHTDETTGGKRFWEDFSTPVLWNSYGKRTRSFIVYCNMSDETTPKSPVGGWWNTSNNTLQMSSNDSKEYKSNALLSGEPNYTSNVGYWSDKNIDVSKTITWISTGEFSDSIDKEGSNNISWSAPFRITGHNGENGADGSNIEYIYALCDDEDSLKYPKNGADSAKNAFFDNVENAGTEGFICEGTAWYDHPQGVSNENGKRTEWVWSRSKPAGDSKTAKWEYAPSAVKWSHWGEDGTDGDGVEYIFYATNDKNFSTPPIQQSAIDTSTTNGKYQKALFQVNDFYPGTGFFKKGDGNKKRDRVKNEISSKVDGFSETYFNDQWDSANPFGLASNWTDNPTGTGSTSQYEFVSIRRFTTEDVSGKKTWGEFGEPKLWSSFSIRTRVFVVYCNIPRDITATVQTPTGGYWNVTQDKLQNDSTGGTYSCNALENSHMPDPIPSGTCVWSDTDSDVSNTITWMATGIFYEDGTAPKWSEPHRITGEDGQRGTDGSNMEFIYAISESMVAGTNYPTLDKDDTDATNTDTKEWLFDHVENDDTFDPENGDPKGYAYKNTFWYDRAQPIENVAGKRTEYAWSRYRSAGTTEWTYDPKPFVWAHWGEDGTDGDGVEYIFMLSEDKFTTTLDNWNYVWKSAISDWGPYEKAIYSMDDFIPNLSWFTSNNNSKYHESKPKVKKIIEANGGTFNDGDYYNAWIKVRDRLSFNNMTTYKMGTWYDNPQDLTPSNRYQYVSIRKMDDGEWGLFSYPKLWSKYNISSFTEFAFTATTPDVDLSDYTPEGGTFSEPKPTSDYNNLGLVWSDGPTPVPAEGKTIIWMTSAKFEEDKNASTSPTWSKCQRMADTSTFQVEWSSTDKTLVELADINRSLTNITYNFGTFLKNNSYNENVAEDAWRSAMSKDFGILFGDNSENAILMATCQEKNGVWTDWTITRVKGEKGEAGTSINMKTPITYEVYLDDNNYTIANARTKFNAVKSTLTTPTPSKGYLAVVYPHDMDTNDIYRGDPNLGNALYMCKYNGSSWDEYYNETTVSSTDEAPGDTHPSPNGHLILWDGDSWMDVGNIVGPAGPVSVLLVKYAKDSKDSTEQDKKYEFVEGDNIPNAKYVGFITYPEGSEPGAITDPNDSAWNWQLFKGQDGFGYEYIFKTTSTYDAPSVPVEPTDGNWSTTPNVIPGNGISNETDPNYGWVDEPMEPKAESKYVWMCWRKYDYSTQTWTDFKGSDDTKARLWQVYANSIDSITEYFHADSSINPAETGFTADYGTSDFNNYWKSRDEVCSSPNGDSTTNNIWGRQNKYLFNREVIQYTNSNTEALPAHLVGTWDSGIIDIQDYYCVHTNGEEAPAMKAKKVPDVYNPETDNTTEEGIAKWTTNASKAEMSSTHKYLWNISKRTYSGNKPEDWSEPIVIGVYGKGENGVDSIYADLDNEMDTIQISSSKKVLSVISDGKYISELHLYKGADTLKFNNCEVSGETELESKFKLYYKTNESSGDWSSYTGNTIITEGIEVIRMEISLSVGDTIPEYSNINFVLTNTENQIRRSVTYTLIGTTNPSVFRIIPSDSILVERKSGETTTIVPDSVSVSVVEYIGGTPYPRTSNMTNVDGGFILKKSVNGGTEETVSDYSSIVTTGLLAGDRLTFKLFADTPNTSGGDNDTNPDIVMDTETIFVLKEGSVGPKGDPGNGYRYYYARYNNSMSNDYGNETIPTIASNTLSSNEPIFLLNGVSLSGSSNAQGADESYPYEYRTERSGNDIDGWSDWSKPITIAKYLTVDNISQEVQTAVNKTTEDIKKDLTTATNAINTLSGYFDASGFLKESSFPSGVLSGYISRNSLSDEINTIGIGGLMVDASGGVSLFGYLQNQSEGILNAVGTDISALDGKFKNYATTTELSDVASAMDNFKVDTHDKFAQMDRTVANAQFMTDAEGYLMVDIPEYSIWFNDVNGLSGAYKDPDTRNDVTWVLASILEGSDGSDSDSEIDETTIRTSNTLVPYIIPESKLYNTNTDTVVFVLKKVIPNFNIISQLDDIKTIIGSGITVTLNKLTGKYTIDYADSGSESESDISILAGICTYDEEIPKPVSDDVLVIMYATTDVSNGGENGIFSNLTWKVGVAEGEIGVSAVQGGGINRFSYVNTASLFNVPILPSYKTETDKNLERIQYMLTLNQQYGYGVTNKKADNNENNENYNKYGELNTNGKLSINGLYGPIDYKLIPEDETVEHIINFLKNSGELPRTITNDDEIGIGKSKTYYVATNVSGPIDYTYTVSLPGANEVKYIKPYDEPMFKNKHIFIKTDPEDGFVNDNDGNRQTTAKGVSKDYYDIYITSKYDEIKLTYAYSITPGTPLSDKYNYTCLKLVYWYGEEPEPTVEEENELNSIIIFEAYNTAEPVDPVDPTVNNEPSGSGNVSIFDNIIEPQEDVLLHMKVYADCGSDLTSVDIKYKLETSNRITYTGAFGTDIIISTITEVDSDSSESDYSPKHLKILRRCNDNIAGVDPQSQCNYQFDKNYPISQISTISVTTFTSYLQNIDIRLELDLQNGPGLRNNKFCYMAIPGSYDAKTLQSLSQKFDEYYERTNKNDYFDIKEGGFLNNTEFNTFGITDWQEINTDSSSASIDLKFTNTTAELNKNLGMYTYSYTIIQYYPHDSNSFGFESYMTADVTSERPWYTDSLNDHNRSPFQGTNYGSNLKYLIDKIKVTVKDRERTGEIPPINRRANNKKGSNNPGVKNYIDVLDTEKPYLIATVSELATISQMVSDGIASTSIITKAGETTAVFYAQAVDGGESQIYMNANDVGIESDYFTLNKKGLKLTGNLYAKNTDKNITAGVIGDSSSTDDGIKFFAGINLPSTYSDSEIKNAVKKAKFYVTESGHLHAEDADISGNITANNFSASMTYNSVKKTSIMNAERFEVTSEFSQDGSTQIAKIYISVEPEIAAGSGDLSANGKTLTNVPTLCMQYGGRKYYLTPDMWKSFDPKTYYDVKMEVSDSYYEIFVKDFTGLFYAQWELWVEEMYNPDNIWRIVLDDTAVQYNKPSQYIAGPFASIVGVNNIIPPSLLGKKVKVKISLFTPFGDLPIATRENIDIPYKNDQGVTTVHVDGCKFTFNETQPGTGIGVWNITY